MKEDVDRRAKPSETDTWPSFEKDRKGEQYCKIFPETTIRQWLDSD